LLKTHILENYDVDESKIRVIHRGVDAEYFNPANLSNDTIAALKMKYHVPKSVPVILLPARMTRWKGHETLIQALHLIRNKDFYCIIAGDLSRHPSFTEEVRTLVHNLKLQSKIQIFGPESDMFGLYGISDIILSTSIEPEAFGRVIIEGQAMEKVVIASNIGGAAETIIDENNGYHVCPASAKDLANKLSFVLDNLETSDMAKLRKNARITSTTNFSLKKCKKTLDVYQEII
jgi:glycosyltransferase involved in cell wall biosynthesis